MYLALLDKDKKELFLNLEIIISMADGEFGEEEKNIIDAHCFEMQIDDNNYESWMTIDEIIYGINEKCSDVEKRIIYMELATVVLADGVYHKEEQIMLEDYALHFGISDKAAASIIETLFEMRTIYTKCANFVNGEGLDE